MRGPRARCLSGNHVCHTCAGSTTWSSTLTILGSCWSTERSPLAVGSAEELAGVDVERGAGDARREVGGEEQHRVRHLVLGGDAPEGHLLGLRRELILVGHAVLRCVAFDPATD